MGWMGTKGGIDILEETCLDIGTFGRAVLPAFFT